MDTNELGESTGHLDPVVPDAKVNPRRLRAATKEIDHKWGGIGAAQAEKLARMALGARVRTAEDRIEKIAALVRLPPDRVRDVLEATESPL